MGASRQENEPEEMTNKKTRRFFPMTRTGLGVLLAAFVAALMGGYFIVPELLIRAGRVLIAESEPFQADAIVILAGGGPERSREAADMYSAGMAPRVVLTTQQLSDNYVEMRRLGIELFLPHDNDIRVLTGLGVPDRSIMRIETIATETLDEVTRVREFSEEQGWSRLIIVTSNYHTRRVLLITRYIFDSNWQIAVIGSRYSEYRPDGWWREVRNARIFLIEFQKLLLYEFYLLPRIWF
jgi:uncharacterized SAM-binding protein YcdF (DUF218 family)